MLKHVIRFAVLLIVAGGIAFWFLSRPDRARLTIADVTGARPKITAPRSELLPTVSIAEVAGWPQGGKPTPAAGLRVQPFAAGLDHPRWMLLLPNGDVLVAETNSPPREGGGIKGWVMQRLMSKAGAGVPSANRITLLRDADGDGVAESRTPLLTGLNSPFGMVLLGDHLYVANTDALVRFPFRPGQTRITDPAEKVIDLPGGGNHWARNVVAAPDGSRLYVSVGSSSNIGENGMEAENRRAAVIEVDPKTKYSRIYATGLRNPVGMGWEPIRQRLWTVVNERDMLGSDLAPDYMTSLELGENYGWPWYYWGGYPDTRVDPPNPALQEYSKRPDYALGPHTASLGLQFADATNLGTRFNQGVFIGQHGSWNRVPVSGYKVIFVPFADNGFPTPNVKPVDVLTGFLSPDGKAWGRPVGVIADRTGALLVADDVGNAIWRVSAAGGRSAPSRQVASR